MDKQDKWKTRLREKSEKEINIQKKIGKSAIHTYNSITYKTTIHIKTKRRGKNTYLDFIVFTVQDL